MKKELRSTRDAFGETLLNLGLQDNNIFALSADLKDSLNLAEFAKKLPNQFIECGVAEQNMVGIATGLAITAKIPFACSFSVFSPGKTWDQIRVGICLSNLNVKIIGGHGGLSNYKDGASHQAFEDIAITRVLPNLKVIVPCDYTQTVKVINAVSKDLGATYIRLSSEKTPSITTKYSKFEVGKGELLKKGNELIVISYGPIIQKILGAIDKAGINATVINMVTIKPLDTEIIENALKDTKHLITVEDHQIIGGLGSAVAEYLAENHKKVNFKRIGVKDTFGLSAKNINELYTHFGFNEDSLAKQFIEFINN